MSPIENPLDAFDFALPSDRIAQHPTPERDGARLMHLDRATGAVADGCVRDLPDSLREGDLMVVNTTRVRPARIRGARTTGGKAEALLVRDLGCGRFEALVRTRGRLREGLEFRFGVGALEETCSVVDVGQRGLVTLQFRADADPYAVGEPPLPPYIERDAEANHDRERYQTVYASDPGAVAAPTAGLHLSNELLARLDARGIERADLVLHVGPGTFWPVETADWERGTLHRERYSLPAACADAVARTRARGGRVVAVGTTATRVLEARAGENGCVSAGEGETDLFLRPGARFHVVDALLTNFHLPRSSLLMLVSAFATRERILHAYAEAVARGYRFYSYGDAMLIQ